MAVDLSIAIISYNTRELLLQCLRSVYETAQRLTIEPVVVDNGSNDGSVEAVRAVFPRTRVIVNPDNRGYAQAANQALAISAGRYFLLLNSDTIMQDEALARMVACLDADPGIGALGCQQHTGEGRAYRSHFPFPDLREHLLHAAWLKAWLPAQTSSHARTGSESAGLRDVDWVNGACLMLRTQALRQVGGLDERFFMYFEDVDLCVRIRRLGYRVCFFPDAHIIHLVGGSSAGHRDRLNLDWELSRITFVETHYPFLHRLVMKGWIIGGAVVRVIRLLSRRPVTGEGRRLLRNNVRCIWRALGSDEARARAERVAHESIGSTANPNQ